MLNLARIFTVGAMVLTMSVTAVTAFATTSDSDTETTEALLCNNATKVEKLDLKRDRLAAKVEQGILTQDEADEIIKAIEENQANCDGTGSERIGQKMGANLGLQGKCMGTGCFGKNGGNAGRGLGICATQ